jgi:hypothetical protein
MPQPDENKEWDPGGDFPLRDNHFYSMIVSAIDRMDDGDGGQDVESRTDLDSHANMPVVGRQAYILAEHNRTCDVSPYSPDYEPMKVPLVDAAVKYECPFDGGVHILVIQNALYVPSMDHNLVPPFMMREAGVIVKDTPKIQLEDPTEEDHAITFPETGFRIPLSLWGVFSCFPTSKPTLQDLEDPSSVYMITPPKWNPHSDAYAKNEELMLDWEGNMRPLKDREVRVILDEIPEDEVMVSSLCVPPAEGAYIDSLMHNDDEPDEASPTQLYDGPSFADALSKRAEEGDFKMSIGATHSSDSTLLTVLSEDEWSDDTSEDTEEEREDDWEGLEAEIDDFMASAVATFASGVTPEHLSKVWRISHEEAKRTIDNTTHLSVRPRDTTLSRNYGTNDRMLRYKRIKDYFYMDTFFATKKGGKSSRGHTCCQLFVTDKGFVYVVPMRRKGDVLQAMKQFAKYNFEVEQNAKALLKMP